MTDTQELRRLHGAATDEADFKTIMAWDAAIDDALPKLLDAADELARVREVLGSEEAVERVARDMCVTGVFDPDEIMPNDGPRWRYYVPMAVAAIAALVQMMGEG